MDEKHALISRILNFSCVDGPGNRLVIFVQGCNFNCKNCHNPHTINHCNHCGDCVSGCPTQALSFDQGNKVVWDESLCTQCDHCIDVCPHKSSPKIHSYSVTEVVELIKQQRYFISGITVSGGEATLQLPFIAQLFERVKSDPELTHLTCFIDSNGYLNESGWQRVEPWLDGVMIDLKAWQHETYQWLVGRSNHRVIASIKYLARIGKLYELRLLHIPGKSDLDSQLNDVTRLINALPDDVVIRLNAFQHHGVVGEALSWEKCSQSEMTRFHQRLAGKITQSITLPTVYT
ncbi:YjjW family glycine radical enzyme activase [Vibrio sp. TRT 29B02]|uniref:YjjW family glycine radical enzyme activase n=1 Tax=Vibrio sp. TRT 29B02 TaxID=3418508 RepID=UPI003CF82F0C